jgi:Ca-activated chloride channel family protein
MRQFGFDETTLKKIAQMTNGKYFRAADLSSLTDVFAQIDKLEKNPAKLTKYSEYRDLFPWFVSTGLGLLLLELALAQTVWRSLP